MIKSNTPKQFDNERKKEAKLEGRIRSALKETDWDETPTVDIVYRQPTPTTASDGSILHGNPIPEIVVRRHQHPPPKIEESGVDGERCSISRITKPLYDLILSEHDL